VRFAVPSLAPTRRRLRIVSLFSVAAPSRRNFHSVLGETPAHRRTLGGSHGGAIHCPAPRPKRLFAPSGRDVDVVDLARRRRKGDAVLTHA
jgi:hypothetical protein